MRLTFHPSTLSFLRTHFKLYDGFLISCVVLRKRRPFYILFCSGRMGMLIQFCFGWEEKKQRAVDSHTVDQDLRLYRNGRPQRRISYVAADNSVRWCSSGTSTLILNRTIKAYSFCFFSFTRKTRKCGFLYWRRSVQASSHCTRSGGLQ